MVVLAVSARRLCGSTKTQKLVVNCLCACGNLAKESCHDPPREGFFGGRELPIGSASRNVDVTSRLEFSIGSRRLHLGRGSRNTRTPSPGTLSEAIATLKNRQQQGIIVDWYTFVEILKRCSKEKDLMAARQLHDCIIQSRMDKNPYVTTTLMNVYVKCERLQDARRLFDRIDKKTVLTWNIMIGAYSKNDNAEDALQVFNQMRQAGAQPDEFTYWSVLKACANPVALKWGEEVHTYIKLAGLEADVRLGAALVHMYVKCGCITNARRVFEDLTNPDVITSSLMIDALAEPGNIDDARQIFDKMEKRDVIAWSTIIGAYAKCGCGVEAYRLFLRMQREGFTPNAITYLSILNAAASAGALGWVKEVHSHAVQAGLESDLLLSNALVHMYAKSGSIDDARLVFDRMKRRDVSSWNIMIGGLAQHGCGHEALELFNKMNSDGVKPDGTSFVAVLSACCHAGLLDNGRKLFRAMKQDYGIEPTVVHHTCMVDLLGRAGHLEEAKLFITGMSAEPDGVIWKAFLGACKTYGNVEMGKLAAEELLKLEPKDSSPYVLLSNIYAAAGQWEQVSSLRKMMQKRGVKKEPGRSWIEVDEKIHEFVVGDTSHPEAKAIHAELNKLMESLKAEGYIPNTQLVLQDIDEEDKELALCSHSEKLAIAYGLMHTPPGKLIRVYKNLRVCSDCHAATKFISKVTRREILARDAIRFHHFKDGVCSCGDYW